MSTGSCWDRAHISCMPRVQVLVVDLAKRETHGRLHRKERHNLEQVVVDDIADGAYFDRSRRGPWG